MISEAIQAVSEGLFRRLFRFVFRYDIFISYARGDGARYAAALKDQLTKLDFNCFLDVEELPVGNALTRSLQRALKGSATLVVVATERATASQYCGLEVNQFARTERAIVPIDFGGTVARAPWACIKEREIVWIDEVPDALARGVPSPIVADSIDRLFKYTRRNVRVRGQWIGVLALFLLGAAAATLMIRQQVKEARAATVEAQKQKVEAAKQTALADEATRTAVTAREQADQAAQEARRQEGLALQSAERARQEQRKAQAQTRLATSNSMAIDARGQIDRRPMGALMLAAEAAQVVLRGGGARAPAAEDALRQALTRVGGVPLTGHDSTVFVTSLSPDRHWLVTSGRDGVARLWNMREPRLDRPQYLLRGHRGYISAARFSPDSRRLATGGEDDRVLVWDLEKSPPTATELLVDKRSAGTVTWSSDGRMLGIGGALWELSSATPAKPAFLLQGHSSYYPIEHFHFSADGRWLLTVGRDPFALLWDLRAGLPTAMPTKLTCAHDTAKAGITPDSHWLVLEGPKGLLLLFDLNAPDVAASIRELPSGGEHIYRMAISNDSRWIAAGGEGRTARLWDLTKPDPVQSAFSLTHAGSGTMTDAVQLLVFGPDSKLLITGITSNGGDGAHLWRLDQPDVAASRVSLVDVGSSVSVGAFIARDEIALAAPNGTLGVWNALGGPIQDFPSQLIGHDTGIEQVWATESGFVTRAGDASPRFWNREDPNPGAISRRLSNEQRHDGRVMLTPDGQWLMSENQQRTSIRLFKAGQAPNQFSLQRHLPGPWLAISPDGRWVASVDSREVANDKRLDAVNLVDLRGKQDGNAELVGSVESAINRDERNSFPNRFTAAAFSPDNKLFAAGRENGSVQIWTLPAGKGPRGRTLRAHASRVEVMAFSNDGHWLVTGGADQKAMLWNLRAKDLAATRRVLSGHDGSVHVVRFSGDGHWLFTGSRLSYDIGDGKLSAFLWDLRRPGTRGRVLPGHDGYITAADISPDGRWLATGTNVGSYLRLWDLSHENPAAAPFKLEGSHGPIRYLEFSRDSHLLLTRSESDARLWDMRQVSGATQPYVMGRGSGDIWWAGFSPDGRMLVTGGSREGTVKVWDLTAADPTVAPVPLRGDAGGLFAGAISRDGRVLVGSSNEGLKTWLLQPADLVKAACDVAGRNMYQIEWDLLIPGQRYRKSCPQFPVPEP